MRFVKRASTVKDATRSQVLAAVHRGVTGPGIARELSLPQSTANKLIARHRQGGQFKRIAGRSLMRALREEDFSKPEVARRFGISERGLRNLIGRLGLSPTVEDIKAALEKTEGNIKQAAKLLDISPRSIRHTAKANKKLAEFIESLSAESAEADTQKRKQDAERALGVLNACRGNISEAARLFRKRRTAFDELIHSSPEAMEKASAIIGSHRVTREKIVDALLKSGGNKKKARKILDIARPTFDNYCKKFGVGNEAIHRIKSVAAMQSPAIFGKELVPVPGKGAQPKPVNRRMTKMGEFSIDLAGFEKSERQKISELKQRLARAMEHGPKREKRFATWALKGFLAKQDSYREKHGLPARGERTKARNALAGKPLGTTVEINGHIWEKIYLGVDYNGPAPKKKG